LQDWLKGGKRSLERVPVVTDAYAYGIEWVNWWRASQPKERNTKEWPFPRNASIDAGWDRFPATGKDGIFIAIMALSWWANAVRSPNEISFFEEAVTDLHWVIGELIDNKTTPEPPLPPDEPDSLQPVSTRRRPKPTPRPPASSSHPPISTPHPRAPSSRPPVSNAHVYQRAEGKRVVKPSRKIQGA
jgi:hypothetical protein